MRTLAEMVARVRRYVSDVGEGQWGDGGIEGFLEDAALSMWQDFSRWPEGRRLMRAVSVASSFVDDTEVYSLPSDCLRLDEVQCRADDDDRWRRIARRDPCDVRARPASGNAHLFGRGSSVFGGLFWFDDVDAGGFRIWPVGATAPVGEFRVRYCYEPVFPVVDGGTLADPAGDASVVYVLPRRVDAAVECLAAAMMLAEEIENGLPAGQYGRLYAQTMQGILGAGSPTAAKTRYIGRG